MTLASSRLVKQARKSNKKIDPLGKQGEEKKIKAQATSEGERAEGGRCHPDG
jgi:hypothetical protein